MTHVKTVAILLVFIALNCAAGCHSAANHRPADFVVTNDLVGPPIVGFGAQLNPYLYCHPNWGRVNEQNVQDLEAKVIALHPQHVRIFCLLDWFTAAGDSEIAKGDPRIRESFIRTVRLAQRAGASVNLTLWYGFWQTPDESARKFADILRDLVEDEHLTAIQYVTLGNEPNDHEDKISIDLYNENYRALNRELRRVGLRDRIKIISGDLVATNQQRWIANLGGNLADVSDGYSTHMYWDYWDPAKLLRRVSEVPAASAGVARGSTPPASTSPNSACAEFTVPRARARRTTPMARSSPTHQPKRRKSPGSCSKRSTVDTSPPSNGIAMTHGMTGSCIMA